MSTAKEKLAEVRAARAKLAAERAARVESTRVEDELAEEERLLALEQATLEAEAAHGPLNRKIAIVHARRADGSILGSVILKKPNHQVWRRWQSTDHPSAKAKDEALSHLLEHCRVWPDTAAFDALLEELPATSIRMLDAVTKLAGIQTEDIQGKS